ncbi:hypothetical protein Ahy_A03g011751 [Arachis hypogaea]|uniref:HAT C-terminal dimerisation domain-containing protein n=1 Tax=Arachis hypogaea TaxID=3818 RepID=A0A445DRN2_ARAHY|nr:hypothetical protein Ahy_A03g011751 [Arachis hypogaea]
MPRASFSSSVPQPSAIEAHSHTPSPHSGTPHAPLRLWQSPLPTAQADPVTLTPSSLPTAHSKSRSTQHAVADSSLSHLFTNLRVSPQSPPKIFVRCCPASRRRCSALLFLLPLLCSLLRSSFQVFYSEVVDDKGRDDGGDSSSIVLDDNFKISTGAKGVSENRVNMWKKQKREKANVDSKSDVERYLAEDTVEDENFNILTWWKVNASKYRILSLIARDILGIPVSTVASKSCFSTGGRVLDVFRSSLSPLMAEALICTQSWLCPSKQDVGDQEFD